MLADAPLLQSLAIGLVIAGVVILAYSFRSVLARPFTRNTATTETPAPPRSSPDSATLRLAAPAKTPQPIAIEASDAPLRSVMDDAEELAQLISDRLDRQAARLEQLIAAADDRLTRLEAAAARAPEPVSQPAPRPPRPPRDTTDPLTRQIYDLSDRGTPPVEIARQLNQHTGKVELILALRQH